MSVASILAFMAAGAAFKTPLRDKAVESPTRTSYAKLKAEVAELEGKVGKFEDAIATANAHARRDQELIDFWRERALAAIPGPQAAPQILLHQMAQGQNAAAAQLAQYANYHAQQNAQQNQILGQGLGLLGAQMIDAELFCNCVPSRSQVWAATG